MSILIKGTSLPKNLFESLYVSIDNRGDVCVYQNSKRLDYVKAIELPHERLVNADVLLEEVYKLRMWLLENNMPGAEHWVTKVYQMIDEVADNYQSKGEE